MSKKPPYCVPGSRSVIGSGITPAAFTNLERKLGELTPPGLVSDPKGAASVAGLAGASTPAVAAFNTSQVMMVPLNESPD